MKRRYLIPLACVPFLLAGDCDMPTHEQERARIEKETVNEIYYIRDEKTHLCFAAIDSQTAHMYHVRSIATVPCEALQENQK